MALKKKEKLYNHVSLLCLFCLGIIKIVFFCLKHNLSPNVKIIVDIVGISLEALGLVVLFIIWFMIRNCISTGEVMVWAWLVCLDRLEFFGKVNSSIPWGLIVLSISILYC